MMMTQIHETPIPFGTAIHQFTAPTSAAVATSKPSPTSSNLWGS